MTNKPDVIGQKIKAALSGSYWKCSRLERISGGNANFTYRGYLDLDERENVNSTVVIKHAEPYVALNQAWELDVGRNTFEGLMLETLSDHPPTKSGNFLVRTPKFLAKDVMPHTLIVEDLQDSITVKEYLSKHGRKLSSEESTGLGFALGAWLKDFHAFINGPGGEAEGVRVLLRGNTLLDVRESLYIGSYHESMEKFPQISWPDEETFIEIETTVKNMCRNGGDGIHGDFWTGNMILKDKPLTPPSSKKPSTSGPTKILILDFEVSHVGSRPQDLAQCLAELYMVHHFYGAAAPLEVMKGVAEGYFTDNAMASKTETEKEEFVLQTAMHFGIHIVTIPWKFGWPEGQKMVECLRFGNDCLVNGFKKRKEWFADKPLACLFA